MLKINTYIYICEYITIYIIYMAASHLKGYAGLSNKVSWGQNAEGVRRESDAPPARPYPGAKRRAALAASKWH